MTILQDKPTQLTPSDAVVELIALALVRENPNPRFAISRARIDARIALSALSDAGLAVLPLRATDHMRDAVLYDDDGQESIKHDWGVMARAFHPSQLEKTDGDS